MPKPPRPSTRVTVYWSIFVPSGSSAGSCSSIAGIPQQISGHGHPRLERCYLYQFWRQHGLAALPSAKAWMMVLAHGPNGWSYPPVGLYALLGQHNMRAISCEMGVARMPGARRHWIVAGMLVVLLSGLASGASLAQDAKLLAECAAPQRVDSTGASPGAPLVTATVSCEVRSTDAIAFKSVRAAVKGRSEPLEADFRGFDTRSNSLVAMFLIQILEPGRRATLTQMTDAVVKIAEQRDGNRRLAAYSFANDLNLVADFDASKRDFERQVRAVRATALPSQ